MNLHSEVEAKFDASKVSLKQYHDFISGQSGEFINTKVVRIDSYKAVSGKDTYYDLNGSKLRYREGDMAGGELTYKQRKSDKSIADRVEINLPFSSKVSPNDVHTMISYLGGKEVFNIHKTSYIYHVTGQLSADNVGDPRYIAVIALYDVTDEDDKTRRFLEVEIEASSPCTVEVGRKALDRWIRIVKNGLEVEGPLNESLFEIYSKGKQTNDSIRI